jgi:hypothetical protein
MESKELQIARDIDKVLNGVLKHAPTIRKGFAKKNPQNVKVNNKLAQWHSNIATWADMSKDVIKMLEEHEQENKKV